MKKVILAILLVSTIIIVSLLYIRLEDKDMKYVPRENIVMTSFSPDNMFRLDVYLNSGNATVAYSITVDVYSYADNTMRALYYAYRTNEAEIIRQSNTVVNINGVELNVIHDRYNSKWSS